MTRSDREAWTRGRLALMLDKRALDPEDRKALKWAILALERLQERDRVSSYADD